MKSKLIFIIIILFVSYSVAFFSNQDSKKEITSLKNTISEINQRKDLLSQYEEKLFIIENLNTEIQNQENQKNTYEEEEKSLENNIENKKYSIEKYTNSK